MWLWQHVWQQASCRTENGINYGWLQHISVLHSSVGVNPFPARGSPTTAASFPTGSFGCMSGSLCEYSLYQVAVKHFSKYNQSAPRLMVTVLRGIRIFYINRV